MTNGWISTAERMPGEHDGDPQGCVLVWHEYQGVMVTGWHNVPKNQFFSHWMKPPGPAEGKGKKCP
jgi:hypothetical protein